MQDEGYDYSCDSNDEYLYPDTNVLINHFGIKDKKSLAEQAQRQALFIMRLLPDFGGHIIRWTILDTVTHS
jgi:fido (protein-threonine AMPylation protein)